MRWVLSIALAAVVVASSTSPARGASEGNNALCSQDFENAEYLLRCDAAAWSLVATGRSYAWKFWYDPDDSSSRRYKILGGAAVSWPYEGPGRFFYQLTVSNGTPSGTQVYGPYAVDIADSPPVEQEPNPPTEPTTEPDNQPDPVTAGFQVSASSVKVNEDVTFTADQPAADDIWFQWQFSDGYGSYSPSVTRSFSAAGNVDVKLSVYQKQDGRWNLADVSEWSTITVRSADLKPLLTVEGTLGENLGIGVAHGVAWVLGRSKLATVEVSDPADREFGEVLATSVQFKSRATALAVSYQFVAVGAGTLGVFLFDATKPENLTPLLNERFLVNASSTLAYPVTTLAFDGNLLVVGLSNGMRVLDVSNPASPRQVAAVSGFTPRCLLVHDDILFVGRNYPSGFDYYTAPSSGSLAETAPSRLGFVSTRSVPRQMDARDGILVVNQSSYLGGDVSFHDMAAGFELISAVGGQGAFYRGAATFGGAAYSTSPTSLVVIRLDEHGAAEPETSTPLGSGLYGSFVTVDPSGLILAGVSNATLVAFRLE